MSEVLEQLDALRAKTDIRGSNERLEQFRADFKAAWRHWRETGQISDQELAEGYAEASAAVRAHAGDREWMDGAMSHFRGVVAVSERDKTRAKRIRDEVRAEREQAA